MTVWEFSWLTLMTELEVQKDPSKTTFFQLLVSDEGQNHLPTLPHTPKIKTGLIFNIEHCSVIESRWNNIELD